MNILTHFTESFGSISPAEFFYRNRQMAGFGNPTQAVYSTVRELVENSLDACEDASRIPEIIVRIQNAESGEVVISVADNGTGVPYEQVANSFGRVLYGSKYSSRQKRGTFGLGVTMAVLYGQITTDKPVIIHTQTQNTTGKVFHILIDVEKNKPVVEFNRCAKRYDIGTTVTIHMKGDFKRSQERVFEYLKLTTLSTPHAKIMYEIDKKIISQMGGWETVMPPPSIISRPHPRSADFEMLRRLIVDAKDKQTRDFLIDSFQQVGKRTATQFIRFMTLDPRQPVGTLSRDDISRLGNALRHFDGFGRPDSKCLSPIGKEPFIRSVGSLYNVTNLSYAYRGPNEWSGNSFIVEAVLALGDNFPISDVPTLYRFANRVPLLYDASEDVLSKVLKRVTWSRYGIDRSRPSALFVHFCSSRVPYKAAGKQSIDSMAAIEDETLSLFRVLGRNIGKSLKKQAHSTRNVRKRREYAKHIRLVAKYSAELANIDEIPSINHLVHTLFEVEDVV